MTQFPITLSIAPMMEYTDRHYRYLMRLLCPKIILYTEMITAAALAHGDVNKLLTFDVIEHPLVLQLGGSDPDLLAKAATTAAHYKYDAINLNVGCPSPRVQQGRFGACLMAEPNLVADCVMAMREASQLPVTVKTRLGIGRAHIHEYLYPLLNTLQTVQVQEIILHARNAWLEGLSPKENRTVPPLDYAAALQVQQDFSNMVFTINGGIQTVNDIVQLAKQFNGVMIGRAAYHHPYMLAEAERLLYPDTTALPTRYDVIQQYYQYVCEQVQQGVRLYTMIKPLLGLFNSEPKGRLWRRLLSEQNNRNDPTVILQALEQIVI
jgi:tRNA-dihydrouridine synthase A